MQDCNFIPYRLLLQGYESLTAKEKIIWKWCELKYWFWKKFCYRGED